MVLPLSHPLLLALVLSERRYRRLFYSTYWLFPLLMYSLSFATTSITLSIIHTCIALMLASLYGWSGAAKLFSPSFYQWTAPQVFQPMYLTLDYLLVQLRVLPSLSSVQPHSEERHNRLLLVINSITASLYSSSCFDLDR
jgi:hypothetical protein